MSFFRYPGGKYKLRKEITKRLTTQVIHKGVEYREPFFGGGSIGLELLNKNPDITRVWLNDKDTSIACLWTAVIQYPAYLKRCVQRFTPSVKAFHDFQRELPEIYDVPKESGKVVDVGFKKIAIHQISYSGLGTKSGGPLGGEDQKSPYKIDCRWSPDYICEQIDRAHHLFTKVQLHNECCTNLDFSGLLEDTSCDALLYLDPPYYEKGNELYECGFSLVDHERLMSALKETKHPWVLSYDDCLQVRSLYKWANVDSLGVNYSIKAARNKPELLIFPNGVKHG